jgi:hypothetical protein
MEYQGLTTDDLANVRALNRAWLALGMPRTGEPLPLSRERQKRLAAAPFLLFSYQEQDTGLWQRLLAPGAQRDLFQQPSAGGLRDLQAAGLAFLWELTRRNPYAARVVCGAPLQWCEQLAAATLVRVHECARARDLARWRLPPDSPINRRLLRHGSSAVREPRIAAQLAALQSLLTTGPAPHYGRLQAAACRIPGVSRRISNEV